MSSSSAEPEQSSQMFLNLFPCLLPCMQCLLSLVTHIYSWSLTFRQRLNFADSLQCMSKMHPCLWFRHLPTLIFIWRTVFFFLSSPDRWLVPASWKDNIHNRFPSSWNHCLMSLYWLSFPCHPEHYISSWLSLSILHHAVPVGVSSKHSSSTGWSSDGMSGLSSCFRRTLPPTIPKTISSSFIHLNLSMSKWLLGT